MERGLSEQRGSLTLQHNSSSASAASDSTKPKVTTLYTAKQILQSLKCTVQEDRVLLYALGALTAVLWSFVHTSIRLLHHIHCTMTAISIQDSHNLTGRALSQ